MLTADLSHLIVEQKAIPSQHLNRYVIIDCYLPKNIADPSSLSLLLINDGQNLDEMPFDEMLNGLLGSNTIQPLMCIGIHAGKDRKSEYGTAHTADYAGRGAKAGDYERFVLDELLPFIHTEYAIEQFRHQGFAGFSLGGLLAIDMVWNYPDVFSVAGVFSGSLWWRIKSLDDGYNDDTDRIMHERIRNSNYQPGLRFYFTTGSLDEMADRNNNGIIDSIDDTQDLIAVLENLGYHRGTDIDYVNYEDGRHDIPTWGRALPRFLLWAFRITDNTDY